MKYRRWLEPNPEGGRVRLMVQYGDDPPWDANANCAYYDSLPSPFAGLPEKDIEEYVYNRLVDEGGYEWVGRQWWLGPHDKPDIVARHDHDDHAHFTIYEIKATACSWKHYQQANRYVQRLAQLVGPHRVRAAVVAPDLRLSVPWNWGRIHWIPPDWLDYEDDEELES